MAFAGIVCAQPFTHQDTLRGSITPERAWWDLTFYDLAIDVDIENKMLRGKNTIAFNVLNPHQIMQLDLQEPLKITNVDFKGKSLIFKREGNVYWITFPQPLLKGTSEKIAVSYEGHPVEAVRPPWDGGLTWSKDEQKNPFVATSCQGLGSSVWWPCKDHMYDEPDSMLIRITTPAALMDVSNGRLRHIDYHPDGKHTWHWFVSNPINNYGLNANIGNYAHWADTLHGENGVLDLDYYVLEHHYDTARIHFDDVPKTIRAFEYWFGPYPFYADGYKLVEVPYLGMEHQSSVTYGNRFRKGYLGRDLSSTGWGLKWDFIIVHESAHEWWANNVTYRDIADMWIHESFANYAESLFLDYHFGRQAANEYVIGTRLNISNDRPIIGAYNVNREGSGDMYFKGGNMLHSLRNWLNDDVLWRNILRGIQKEFYHQTVTTAQIENYISKTSGKNLDPFFDQYLRDIRVPTLEYAKKKKTLRYRYINIVEGFNMPLDVTIDKGQKLRIYPTSEWQTIKQNTTVNSIQIDPNFYVLTKEAGKS
ncbi:MAG TPA: M1 family metallopeptidase [Saprospiraceae bacterium]|nr:M1 family metallopeptidase [Saprospiraceae bacterium]